MLPTVWRQLTTLGTNGLERRPATDPHRAPVADRRRPAAGGRVRAPNRRHAPSVRHGAAGHAPSHLAELEGRG